MCVCVCVCVKPDVNDFGFPRIFVTLRFFLLGMTRRKAVHALSNVRWNSHFFENFTIFFFSIYLYFLFIYSAPVKSTYYYYIVSKIDIDISKEGFKCNFAPMLHTFVFDVLMS